MRDLWNAVKEAQTSGSTAEAVETAYPLEKKFAYLGPYFDLASKGTIARHKENIQTFWRAGLKSAGPGRLRDKHGGFPAVLECLGQPRRSIYVGVRR